MISAAASSAAAAPGAAGSAIQGLLGPLGQGTAGLAALGQLGEQKGTLDQVKALGSKLVSDNTGVTDQLKAAATAAGATIPDGPAADLQSTLSNLQSQSPGPALDQSWLQAVQGALQATQTAAQNVLDSADARRRPRRPRRRR